MRWREDLIRKVFEHSNNAIFLINPDDDRIIDTDPKSSGIPECPAYEISCSTKHGVRLPAGISASSTSIDDKPVHVTGTVNLMIFM